MTHVWQYFISLHMTSFQCKLDRMVLSLYLNSTDFEQGTKSNVRYRDTPAIQNALNFSAILESIYNQRISHTSWEATTKVYIPGVLHIIAVLCVLLWLNVAWCHLHNFLFLYCQWINHTIHRQVHISWVIQNYHGQLSYWCYKSFTSD